MKAVSFPPRQYHLQANGFSAVFLLLTARELEARGIRQWSYAQLRDASDVVVIAKAISNIDTKDDFTEMGHYLGINTEFEVEDVVKGNLEAKQFTVLHFKNDPNSSQADGMQVIEFRLKTLASTAAAIHGASVKENEGRPQEYLLFLKRRSDGRYEPATGQMDARMSVKEVSDPFPELGI